MNFRQVMVMGAGAVGGYFGARLSAETSARVSFIARGEHLSIMQQRGLVILSEGKRYELDIDAYRAPEEAPAPDLILFTVKSYDTAKAIDQISGVVGDKTQILTLQNGIENYPQLVNRFGEERVIQGFCQIGAGIQKPGVIEHQAFGKITLGEQDGSVTERVRAVQSLFGKAGIPVKISENITREVWIKFTWNSLFNMVTALTMTTVDEIFEHSECESLCYRLFEEIQQVAEQEGIMLESETGYDMIESARDLEDFETSTYRDREKGKQMEYETFTGAVVRLGKKHGVDVPHHQTLYALLKLIDKT